MSDNQQPKPYDAVLGGQNQPPEGAAVLGGIEGVKLRLSNSNPQVRIGALHQALNYGEPGLDLIIEALQDESPQIQIQAYSLLIPRSEQKVKRALQGKNSQGLKYELNKLITVNRYGEIVQRQQCLAKYFVEDLGNGVDLEIAYIPGGTFLMGSPQNKKYQHLVTVQPFYMGKFTITQAQWQVVAKSFPKIKRDLTKFEGENHPVDCVSWNYAAKFCRWLSKITRKKYRLPSEAEWEYACRAGTTTLFHYGETITSELANYRANFTYNRRPKGEYRQQTTLVGQFPPNAYGLYDMHGNIWEWCQDTWHHNYEGTPADGKAWIDDKDCAIHVLRGGSWSLDYWNCHSAVRREGFQGMSSNDYGFRVACDIF